MTHEFSPVIDQLIQEKMASGRYGSEDELLLEALHLIDKRDETVSDDPSLEQRMKLVETSGALEFWNNSEEDIYSDKDGEPV